MRHRFLVAILAGLPGISPLSTEADAQTPASRAVARPVGPRTISPAPAPVATPRRVVAPAPLPGPRVVSLTPIPGANPSGAAIPDPDLTPDAGPIDDDHEDHAATIRRTAELQKARRTAKAQHAAAIRAKQSRERQAYYQALPAIEAARAQQMAAQAQSVQAAAAVEQVRIGQQRNAIQGQIANQLQMSNQLQYWQYYQRNGYPIPSIGTTPGRPGTVVPIPPVQPVPAPPR